MRQLLPALVIFLILLMGFHAIAPHDHPHGVFGNIQKAPFHHDDRKRLVIAFFAFLLGAGISRIRIQTRIPTMRLFHFPKEHDGALSGPLHEAYRRGILNRRTYE